MLLTLYCFAEKVVADAALTDSGAADNHPLSTLEITRCAAVERLHTHAHIHTLRVIYIYRTRTPMSSLGTSACIHFSTPRERSVSWALAALILFGQTQWLRRLASLFDD